MAPSTSTTLLFLLPSLFSQLALSAATRDICTATKLNNGDDYLVLSYGQVLGGSGPYICQGFSDKLQSHCGLNSRIDCNTPKSRAVGDEYEFVAAFASNSGDPISALECASALWKEAYEHEAKDNVECVILERELPSSQKRSISRIDRSQISNHKKSIEARADPMSRLTQLQKGATIAINLWSLFSNTLPLYIESVILGPHSSPASDTLVIPDQVTLELAKNAFKTVIPRIKDCFVGRTVAAATSEMFFGGENPVELVIAVILPPNDGINSVIRTFGDQQWEELLNIIAEEVFASQMRLSDIFQFGMTATTGGVPDLKQAILTHVKFQIPGLQRG